MDDFHDSVERIEIGSLTLIEHLYTTNNGRLDESTYGNDATLGRLYASETDNTLVGKTINGTVVETYQYDATDTLGVVTDKRINETITYQYDALGRVSSELESRYTNETSYSYDAIDRLNERKSSTAVVNDKYGSFTGV